MHPAEYREDALLRLRDVVLLEVFNETSIVSKPLVL